MNDGSNYQWGDKECSTNYRFVCEFELGSSSTEFTNCKGRTVIDHEQPRTGTDNLPSKNKPGETQMPITYKPSLSQITALIAVSQSCQQYIQYDCLNSKIWDIDNGWPYVWWKSRHGKDMHNFGGVPTGHEGCACGLTDGGCTTSGTKCNCDTEDDSTYSDDGLLSDKETLPVTKLRFGGNDVSNYVLGPLECDGIESSPKRSCAELWLTGERTDMEYDIDPDGADGLGPAFKVFCNLSEAAPILRSCKELMLAGYNTDGYYDIDPDEPNFGEPAFTVFCNMTNTECFNTGKVCNCDDDNIQWMTDGGQLEDKDSLPVYKVYHAHTENDERAGWHTLGPLLCSGMTNDLPMYRTCAELQRAGHVRNGSYLLDSDGPDAGDQPFVAYCDMTNGKTYIFHDLPEATDVKQGTDYNRVVNYAPSINQLKELASLSAGCGQELRFDCNYFPLWDTDLGEMKGWWLNIDGQKMNNWAGAALEDVGCKCDDGQGFACEAASVSLSCIAEEGTITVLTALYGRRVTGDVLCPYSSMSATTNTGCDSSAAADLTIVQGLCDGMSTCSVTSSTSVFGGDPCPGTFKYLRLTYQCSGNSLPDDVPASGNDVKILLQNTADIQIESLATNTVSLSNSIFIELYLLFNSDGFHIGYIGEEPFISILSDIDISSITTVTFETLKFCSCEADSTCTTDIVGADIGVCNYLGICTCNCDAQDGISRSDEGWITDKQFLPVSELHFAANTRSDSEGFVTLGAFQCQGIDIPMLASCDELRSAGFNSSGWYDIDPDGPESPLSSCSVYCDMITGATVIHHDSEYRRLAISEIDVAPDEASFRRPVTYKAPMTHIIALLQSSLYCQQFIRWDCHNAPIWNNGGTGSQLTHWMSRDGEQMLNWGGVNTGVEGCLCATTDSCDGNQNYKCNCDADDDVWRYDEGLIIDSNKLPVTELRFGGINHYLAMGFYTLGPLECFGKSKLYLQ
ncbi:uncharacterized protein [Amphiura filiformis]|uniref:uncharacterized protein n=1 Tax=Amphiura filiformis TaxID=82378 RepID=UPI003B227B0E